MLKLDEQVYILVVLEKQTECIAFLLHSNVVATMLSCVVNRQNIKPAEGATIFNSVASMGIRQNKEVQDLVKDYKQFHNCKFISAEFENFNEAWEILTATFFSLDVGKEIKIALPRHNVTELFSALYRGVGYSNGDTNHPMVKQFIPKMDPV